MNTRTEGTLKREDVERLSRKRMIEQEVGADESPLPDMDFSAGGFQGDLGAPGPLEVEGDSRKTAACMHLMFLGWFSHSIFIKCHGHHCLS